MPVTHNDGTLSSEDEPFDKLSIAELVSQHGSSSATAWLEFDRYKIWQPAENSIPESSFRPVQGYMRKDPYVFAWGNPLVSQLSALAPTAAAFLKWVESHGLRLVWSCVDHDLEQVLAASPFEWSVVSCIYEDVVDPAHIIELTSPEAAGKQGVHVVKDLKKNLKRAEKYDVHVAEVTREKWSEEDRTVVEQGIDEWKKSKSGIQIASTALHPWLDEPHRRYWAGRKDGQIIGILILTPIQNHSWQIKNAVSFPGAPKGTSEALIYAALRDLHAEQQASANSAHQAEAGGQGNGRGTLNNHRVSVTFGISAADEMEPVSNLSGWRVTALAKMYGSVTQAAGLLRRSEFRSKFDSEHEPMYVCYPEDKFGLDGVNTLLKLLKK